MKLKLFSYFNILIILTSCNGRTKENALNSENVNKNISLGDTVNKLGKQLWYVFQDKQNNYWFSSNGEGVYRYDGKTIVNFTTKNGLANDTIRQIQEDKFRNIYFTTFEGLLFLIFLYFYLFLVIFIYFHLFFSFFWGIKKRNERKVED